MTDNEFIAIRVSTLRGDLKIPFDVYIKVAGKYIHYCRSGDSFEGTRLNRLKAKKLKEMFIRPEDEMLYEQYLQENIDSAYDEKSNKALEIRAEVIQGAQQASAEAYMEDPIDKDAYHHVKYSVQRFVDFLGKRPQAAHPILSLENTDLSITHHSVNVATLATMLAMNSKFKDLTKLHLLGLGCMLHDIDHFNREPDLSRPLTELSPEEFASYKQHPLRGANLIQGVTFVDQLVMSVIVQHEEHLNGTGFPRGLTEKEIEPMVLFAATANAYDRLVSFQKQNPKEAIKSLLIDKVGLLPLDLIQNLNSILKSLQIIV